MRYSSVMPSADKVDVEPRTCCVRNCPRLGDDHVEISQGRVDSSHEVFSVYWFCKEHQAVWPFEATITLETSRIETIVKRLDG